jgi:filamentous hemagglutinin
MKVPGKQLDEYPPAMFQEGGAGASVRAINPRDNMAAGACIGIACRGLANGDKVRIKVVD